MKSTITLIVIAWLGCGIVGAGFDNAYFQRKYPEQCSGRRHLGQALLSAVGGPINLFVSFFYTGFGEYGWSLNPIANPRCENRAVGDREIDPTSTPST